jgi:hypothetical protein
MRIVGGAHTVEDGAKRYIDACLDVEGYTYPSGAFVASRAFVAGKMCDQSEFYPEFKDPLYASNVAKAYRQFLKK